MSVRVIAGSCKGRRLKVPRSETVRPTSDRARESLFNVLAPRLEGARFLDGFAGSGAVGIEAISRGAARAVFIENRARTAAILADNIDICRIGEIAEILRAPWKAAAARLADRGDAFDVVFADPPYDRPDPGGLLRDVAEAGILAAGGIAIIEHRTGSVPDPPTGWMPIRVLRVGDTSFSFFGILTDS